MIINELIEEKNISRYRLSKNSGIPYTTITDICSGKAKLEKCSVETVYRIAKELDVTVEELIAPSIEPRPSFEVFKSNVCHQVARLGDLEFIIQTLENDDIRSYYDKKWYPESLYLLAMVDYLSRLNDVPLCTHYDDVRALKLDAMLFPAGIIAATLVTGSDEIKHRAIRDAIPEFARFNIIEGEVRSVI